MTDEEKKLILNWCGIRLVYSNWVMPDGKEYSSLDDVILDLNFYFRYAVLKLDALKIPYRIIFGRALTSVDVEEVYCNIQFAGREHMIGYGKDSHVEAFGQALLKLIRR